MRREVSTVASLHQDAAPLGGDNNTSWTGVGRCYVLSAAAEWPALCAVVTRVEASTTEPRGGGLRESGCLTSTNELLVVF